jgi:hypothetical protein
MKFIERYIHRTYDYLSYEHTFDTEINGETPDRRYAHLMATITSWEYDVQWLDATTREELRPSLMTEETYFQPRASRYHLDSVRNICMPTMRRDLKKNATERRARLLICAWARLHPEAPRVEQYIRASEAKADGVAKDAHMKAIVVEPSLPYDARLLAHIVLSPKIRWGYVNTTHLLQIIKPQHYAALYCIAPVPHLHVAPTFQRTQQMRKMALGLYQKRDWSNMPILWDMLEEAGCQDPYIYEHCQAPYHTRGDWLLDYLIGR